MADQLEIVNRVIEEHAKVRMHLKLTGDSVTDLEGVISLEQAKPDWMLASAEVMSDKCTKLLQASSALREGLKNHFLLEEKYLPPILGKLLIRALELEHVDIQKALDKLHNSAQSCQTTELKGEQLLAMKWNINQTLDDLRQLVEDHAAREEVVLRMAKRALEDKGK